MESLQRVARDDAESVAQLLDRSARGHLLLEDVVEVRVLLLRVEAEVAGRRGLLVARKVWQPICVLIPADFARR
jgi:hypothetical protein